MTTEERLVDALHQADSFQPSPDLYTRLERSIAEDRTHRRRILGWSLGALAGLAMIASWVIVSLQPGPGGSPTIEGWRLVIAYLALIGGVIAGLGPHLRRFGAGFLEGVFLLDEDTGRTFVRVLDVAYYAAFTGLVLVDADQWDLDETLVLWDGLKERLDNVAFVLLAMGLLHVMNLVVLPFIGPVFNSLVRREARRQAGARAPAESVRARRVDSNVHALVIIAIVLAFVLITMIASVAPLGELAQLFD